MKVARTNLSPFTADVILAIALLYGIAGVIFGIRVGLWEAIRRVVVNGLIVSGWLWSADRLLGDAQVPEYGQIRHPLAEAGWALGVLLLAMLLAANRFAGWLLIPSWVYYLVIYGGVLALFIAMRYPLKDLGFSWPSKSGWLALLLAILINILAGLIFQILPPGEAPSAPTSDLSAQLTGVWSVLALVAGIMFRAALPEELLLRVTLQPRLACFMPLGWAIVIQALLFSLGHLPQQVLRYQHPFLLSLGYLLTIDNGLIGGYLWHRTRSLPLLIILHLFAYPRFGV